MRLLAWGGGHEWGGLVAFLAFHALSFFIAIVWEAADASRAWFHILAFLWDLNAATDHVWQWGVATGDAVVFSSQIVINVNFAISWAQDVITVWLGDGFNWHFAVVGWYAFTVGVFQKALCAETSDDAVLGANSAWVWVSAGGWASSAAGLEHFILLANWWHHHQLDQVHFWALFFWDAFSISTTDMVQFACAS